MLKVMKIIALRLMWMNLSLKRLLKKLKKIQNDSMNLAIWMNMENTWFKIQEKSFQLCLPPQKLFLLALPSIKK